MDTACNISQVHPRWLSETYTNQGAVEIQGPNRGTTKYPRTMITLEVEGKTIQLAMAVNSNLGYDAILGVDIPNLHALVPHTTPWRETTPPPWKNRKRKQPRRKCCKVTNYTDIRTSPESGDSEESAHLSSSHSDTEGDPSSTDETGDDEIEAAVEQQELTPSIGLDDLPSFSEDLFEKASERNRTSRVHKRLANQRYANRWGQQVPLEGGKQQLVEAQESDHTLEICRRRSAVPTSPFFYQDDILWREWTPPKQMDMVHQIVLPEEYRETALRMAHLAPWAGHFGRTKTVNRLLRRFFWPGIRKEVAELCKRCQTCQHTAKGIVRKAPLIPLPVFSQPFSRLAMDMVGPLPQTEEGHRYILTLCDYGTRYPEAFPLKATTSKDVAEALVEMFSRVGFPDEILSDRGSNFCSELMEEFLQMFGVSHIKTSAYHPETDGMVERYNATLKSGLRKYIERFGGQWHKSIPYLLFAFRELPHQSTGFSPFELIYGRNPRGPLDVLQEQWREPTKCKESVVSFLLDTYQKLDAARDLAWTTELEAKDKIKTWYDRTARERCFQVDDLVLVLLPSSSNKLLARWQGPYPISEKLSRTTYKVKTGRNSRMNRTFHVNMLARWESTSAICLLSETPQPPLTESEEITTWNDQPTNHLPHINEELPQKQHDELSRLLEAHGQAFQDQPGRTTITAIDIDTGDVKPISSPPYRLPQARMAIVKKEIGDLLRAGLIRVSRSPWAAPIVLVPKKDGSLRLCVDYRKLNAVTRPDPFPMPRVEDLIDGLAGAN